MLYDREKFTAAVRPHFGGRVTPKQYDGMNRILSYAEKYDDPLKFLAYRLATTKLETAHTMQPIEEYGKGKGKAYGPSGFYGRGLVQLTWQDNYIKATRRLHELKLIPADLDLAKSPKRVMDWDIALPILFIGMNEGWFAARKVGGKTIRNKLSDYFSGNEADPIEARRIINGTDKAAEIAAMYHWFVAALLKAEIKEATEPKLCPTCGQPMPTPSA